MPRTVNLVKCPCWEGHRPEEEPTIIALLKGHVVKLASKYFCASPYICSALNIGKRSFLLQGAAVHAETHNWLKC